MSLRFAFILNSIWLRLHIEFTLKSLRVYVDFHSLAPRFHLELIAVSLRFHIDFIYRCRFDAFRLNSMLSPHFDFKLISLRPHFDFGLGSHFVLPRCHFECTSLHFASTSISLRNQFDLTYASIQFYFCFISVSLGWHLDCMCISFRPHFDIPSDSASISLENKGHKPANSQRKGQGSALPKGRVRPPTAFGIEFR